MRAAVRDLVAIAARTLPVEGPIYEFGALQVQGQEGFADLRPFFSGKEYVGTDIREGPGVDVVLDIHDTGLPPDSVGTALVMDTLEHVMYPQQALAEMHRVLRPGGLIFISSHMNWPVHGHPCDYWRFTTEGFRVLLRPFSQIFVEAAGEELSPHTVIGIGRKGATFPLDQLAPEVQAWKQRYTSTGWKAALRPYLPPALLDLYWRLLPTDMERWRKGGG